MLACDNLSVIWIVSNQAFHKHTEINCHLVREKLNVYLLKLLPITSAMKMADISQSSLLLHNSTFLNPSWSWATSTTPT